jgi:predicted AlkP superfamily phosphohydrolase/phosphomutase
MLFRKYKKRTIIIGLDGVPYRVIETLTNSGVMANLAYIIQDGVFRKMASSIPEVSSIAWSTIITGKNAGEHGIYGFMDLMPGSYNLHFPNFSNLKALPFWNSNNDEKSIIINVPGTYPAKRLNGILISGFVALNMERAVYPPKLVSKLKNIEYQIDVDTQKAHMSMDLFLKDIERTLHSRINAYRYLWNMEEWDNFMLVFTGTDRLFHFLWDAYENPSHSYHEFILDHFTQIDGAIGEIRGMMGDDDELIILSDHGFEALAYDVNINYFLKKNGFLKLKDVTPKNYTGIDNSTKAFALDPSRIYLNLEAKYPAGSVKPRDKESIITDLISSFDSLKKNGRKVIKQIFRKEEIYHGPYLEQAPDLILLSHHGFNLKANIRAEVLFDKPKFSGMHSQSDAFLVIKGIENDAIVPKNPTVEDIVHIKNKLDLKRRKK